MSDSCDYMNCIGCQAPLSKLFSRQEYWSGLHFLLQGNFPHFPTWELNPGLPHCREMLYQLWYAGSLTCLSNYPLWVTIISLLFIEYPEKPDIAVKCYVASQRQCQRWKEEPAGKQILGQRRALLWTQGCQRRGPASPGHSSLQLCGLQQHTTRTT